MNDIVAEADRLLEVVADELYMSADAAQDEGILCKEEAGLTRELAATYGSV